MQLIKNTDVVVRKRSYRGNTSYTVEWKADGVNDQSDFDTEQAANSFARSLQQPITPTTSTPTWHDRTEVILEELKITPEELNSFLADLMQKAPNGLKKWLSYINESVSTKEKLNTLALDQSMSAEDYLEKLLLFKGADLDKVHQVYDSYMERQRSTEQCLVEFLDRIRAEEEDEDEVEFTERKLRRFLKAFDMDVDKIEDDSLETYIKDQKGSESVKARLLETLMDFKHFADERISLQS